MKVFLDTNVIVSAVATRGLCADLFQAILTDHDLVVGETVLTELRRILQNKLQAPTETVEEMELFLRREAVVVGDAPVLDIVIRDAADAVVLAEALAAEVDVLVTGIGTCWRSPLTLQSGSSTPGASGKNSAPMTQSTSSAA